MWYLLLIYVKLIKDSRNKSVQGKQSLSLKNKEKKMRLAISLPLLLTADKILGLSLQHLLGLFLQHSYSQMTESVCLSSCTNGLFQPFNWKHRRCMMNKEWGHACYLLLPPFALQEGRESPQHHTPPTWPSRHMITFTTSMTMSPSSRSIRSRSS